jgi:septal ring-binding cell division protein DamX
MAALVSTAILALVVGSIISSQTASTKQERIQSRSQDSDGDTTVQFANQKIKIDPQTGRLRTPTAEEARAIVDTIQGLTNRSSKGLKVQRAADGGSMVDLQGRFQTVVLAKPNADGTNEIRCVTSLEEATAFLGIDASKIPAKDK